MSILKKIRTRVQIKNISNMPDNVLLSKFNILDMETYLDNMKTAGVPFKTMRKSVKDIKHFLRRAKAIGLNPSEDMLTYNILDNLSVVPQDDDLIYKKEVDIDALPDETIKAIINDLYTRMKTDRDAANAFAIFCLFFFFWCKSIRIICNTQRFSS